MMFDKLNSFMRVAGPYITFACFLLYCFLWYMGSTVEAWHVLPWIAIVLINDITEAVEHATEELRKKLP